MPETLLRADRLTRQFGGLVAVDHVSIDLREGEVHASSARTAPANPR